jgi:hypothetical protein
MLRDTKEATMRDIASEAHFLTWPCISLFTIESKDNLFFLVFDESFPCDFMRRFPVALADPNVDIFEKIRLITKEYISIFSEPAFRSTFHYW